MSLVIELSDRAFALASNGVLLQATPSVVRVAGGHSGAAGEPMLAQARLVPTEVSSEHWLQIALDGASARAAMLTAGAEIAARLHSVDGSAAPSVDIVTPALFDTQSLGWVLALLRAQGLTVAAFRDSAVITAAASLVWAIRRRP